jgi:hypothetical protein
MNFSAFGVRRMLALGALAPIAAVAAGCGTSSSGGSPGSTGTVTLTPSSGGTPASTPSTSQIPTVAGPPECATAALRVKIGSSNGAAGTIYYDLVFTNVGTATCLLQGYPGVSLVSAGSASGSQIGADAKRDSVTPSRQIVLATGQTAHAVLGVTEAGDFPASKCNPVTAHWLKVFPPDQTVAAYAPFTTQTCASTSVPTLRITTISSGA